MKFFLLMSGLAMASPDFVDIALDEPAPFAGKLLTNEALAKIISQYERDLTQCTIDSDFNIEKFKANQALKYDLLDIRYKSEVEMYQMMIDTRDQQIKKDKKRDVWQRWATYGAFVLGVGTTVAITYSVNQAAN
tara:strand:- start:811 stop:1212 length:402 start_codon:yes stop_codon:yes gene_type:complete